MEENNSLNERKPMFKNAKWYQEQFINRTDIDYKTISCSRAKEILARIHRFPAWLQNSILNDMEKFKLIKRKKQIIEILPD